MQNLTKPQMAKRIRENLATKKQQMNVNGKKVKIECLSGSIEAMTEYLNFCEGKSEWN